METRVALIAIIVEDSDSVQAINQLLHEYGAHTIGRMGIPDRERGIARMKSGRAARRAFCARSASTY